MDAAGSVTVRHGGVGFGYKGESCMRKIAAFTLKTTGELCVKCGQAMQAGEEVCWLRDPDRKGHYHQQCSALPTQERLTLVRVEDANTREGFKYTRVQDLRSPALLPQHPVEKRLAAPAPRVPNADGVLVNEETLSKLIAEAVAKMPRIIVNVIVPKPGDEAAALELLSKELFMRSEVKAI